MMNLQSQREPELEFVMLIAKVTETLIHTVINLKGERREKSK